MLRWLAPQRHRGTIEPEHRNFCSNFIKKRRSDDEEKPVKILERLIDLVLLLPWKPSQVSESKPFPAMLITRARFERRLQHKSRRLARAAASKAC